MPPTDGLPVGRRSGQHWRSGSGVITVTVPNGQSQLYVNVQAPEGAFDSYIVDVNRCDLCKKTITVATTNNIIVNDISIVPYTLNVLPTSPITANQPFTADLGGTVEVAEFWLDAFQGVIPGGSLDVAIVTQGDRADARRRRDRCGRGSRLGFKRPVRMPIDRYSL